MKNFEYAAPRSEAEVLDFLSTEPGKTELLAGGTDLVGLMKAMIVKPERVVNLMDVPSLKRIERAADGSLFIGAAMALDDVLEHAEMADYSAVTDAIRGINSAQLQAQGTIGGELCQRPQCWYFRNGQGLLADQGRMVAEGDNRFHAIFNNAGPAKFTCGSRLAHGLITLGAKLRVIGPSHDEERFLDVADFYRTPHHDSQRETVLASNQLVTHIVLPVLDGRVSATYDVRQGCGPEYPLASAAASLLIGRGVVQDATIALGQVAPTPWVSEDARRAIVGSPVTPEAAAAAGEAAVSRATPLAQNEYKVQLAQVAVKRAILQAAGLDTGGF